MELLLIVVVLVAFALGAALTGYDSRPKLDDEPHRAI
jgi:hypothetical protein